MSHIAITPDTCPDCGTDWYITGCTAPGCNANTCDDCGNGCDLEADPNGRCATAFNAETPDERAARLNAHRATYGLGPL